MSLFDKFKNSRKIPTESAIVQIVFPGTAPGGYIAKNIVLRSAKMVIDDKTRIIDDCVKLVNESYNPVVFFKRYDLLISLCKEMADMEEYYPFKDPLPSTQLLHLNEQKPLTINDFIDRYYESINSKISKLKTEKARIAKSVEFYNTLSSYNGIMESENIAKYSDLYRQLKTKINEGA